MHVQRAALKVPDGGDWWQGSFDVPRHAEVLDFVFSDTDRQIWDNNRNRDYHVRVQNALTKEALIQACFRTDAAEGGLLSRIFSHKCSMKVLALSATKFEDLYVETIT